MLGIMACYSHLHTVFAAYKRIIICLCCVYSHKVLGIGVHSVHPNQELEHVHIVRATARQHDGIHITLTGMRRGVSVSDS